MAREQKTTSEEMRRERGWCLQLATLEVGEEGLGFARRKRGRPGNGTSRQEDGTAASKAMRRREQGTTSSTRRSSRWREERKVRV